MTKLALILEHKIIVSKPMEFVNWFKCWHCCDLCIVEGIFNRFQFETPNTITRKQIKDTINMSLYPSCKAIDTTSNYDIDNGFINFEIIGKETIQLKISMNSSVVSKP
mgnify:FL=1